jgi:Ca-activated chloride channel family protein
MLKKLMPAIGAMVLMLAPCAAHGQIAITPDSDDTVIIIPQLPRRILPPDRPDRRPPVDLTAVDLHAEIDGQVATTVVKLTLSNPGGRPAEAQVLMPVPQGATVRQFVLEGLGEEGIAQIMAKDEARRIYRQIVSKLRDPGLLEFAGQGLMKSSVFPVPAGGTQVVSLTYEQILPADGDRIDYVFPRSSERSGVTWMMSALIEAERPIATVYSPTHDLVTERISPTKVRVKVPASAASAAGSLSISTLLEAADGLTASLIAYPDPEEAGAGYFLLLAGLPPVAPEDAKPVKREVTLVIDRSGSMRGEKIEQAREAALQVLSGLEDGEAFNIIDYSDSIESFAAAPVIKSDETMRQASAYLESLKATGGTNIHDALLEALRPEPREGYLPMVLFLTDGLPTVGVRSESAIREAVAGSNAHQRRIFTFGVGFDVNAPLLTNIASTSRATTTFVLPDEDVEAKVGHVFKRLSGPVLAAPELTSVGMRQLPASRIREVMPCAMPDLFEGDQLVVLGRYTPGDDLVLKLTGEYFGKEREFTFEFDTSKATAKNGYVPRLWASRKIGALINEIRQAGANGQMPGEEPALSDAHLKELVDEIVRLSIRWGILTEYTAFLAVPEEQRRDFAELLAIEGVLQSNQGGGGQSPFRRARVEAEANLVESQRERAGEEAVRQENNIQTFYLNSTNIAQGQVSDKMGWAGYELKSGISGSDVAANVRNVADQTFFNVANRWVQAELVEVESPQIDETIEYGTDAYDKLVDELIDEGRGAMLAMQGEILLQRAGRNILVVGPSDPTP